MRLSVHLLHRTCSNAVIEAAQDREFWHAVGPAVIISISGVLTAWRAAKSGQASRAHVICLLAALACLMVGVGSTWYWTGETLRIASQSDVTIDMITRAWSLCWSTTFAAAALALAPTALSISTWLRMRGAV